MICRDGRCAGYHRQRRVPCVHMITCGPRWAGEMVWRGRPAATREPTTWDAMPPRSQLGRCQRGSRR